MNFDPPPSVSIYTTDGQLVNTYYTTIMWARSEAQQRNVRAERLGIETRYYARETALGPYTVPYVIHRPLALRIVQD
jgi:hypothetical protein